MVPAADQTVLEWLFPKPWSPSPAEFDQVELDVIEDRVA
jgi:hypothetical protein